MLRVALLLLFVLACTPRPVYDCVMTRNRILGPNEVKTYRVFQVEKKGWLTSDRFHIYLEDGSIEVLQGEWDLVLTPVQ